ncbi:hypothetical protein EAI_06370, partial [Harpegnathos saltator]
HITGDHRFNFVDSEPGVHTQHIERAWREI